MVGLLGHTIRAIGKPQQQQWSDRVKGALQQQQQRASTTEEGRARVSVCASSQRHTAFVKARHARTWPSRHARVGSPARGRHLSVSDFDTLS